MKIILNATLLLAAANLVAQEPPKPARAPQGRAPGVAVAPPAVPAPGTAPTAAVAIAPGVWAIAPVPALPSLDWTPPAPPVAAVAPGLTVIEAPGAYVIAPQGQGRPLRIDQERVRELAEQQRELARRQSELSRELAQRQAEMAREQGRMQADLAREQAQIAREYAQNYNFNYNWNPPTPMALGRTLPERPPAAWAQNDPADSLWRAANDVMGRGDYRKAATLFKEIPVRFKYSQYAVDAMYWQAHALYRVGGTPDLQEALQVLQTLKSTYPSQRIRGSNADVGTLQVRIAGVLNARGQGNTQIVRDAIAANPNACDSEDIQVKSAALNALMQTDKTAAQDYAMKVLAKKDECSRELRRNAIYTLGNTRDGQYTRTFIDVAKTDPNQDVRRTAIEYLGRVTGDDALGALEELLRTSDDQEIQRAAIRALANNSTPRARNGIKALIERNDVNESLRMSALNSLNAELATTEDVNWLQSLYGKTESQRIRSSIISAMARLGGNQNERWFTTLVNNENESIDVRVTALRQVGPNMDIAALIRLYDQTGQRNLRYELVRQLQNRREPEATDKLGDIAKNGTDVEVRKRAIDALTSKARNDERALKVLLQLIDRP